MKPLRIVFAGTPQFAEVHLRALLSTAHPIVGIFTQPDRPAGRGRKLSQNPVKCLGKEAGVPIFQPSTLRGASTQDLEQLKADLMVVVAYGLILPEHVLKTPRLGCVNVHASLLPRWRGAAPIQRAIEAGDSQTGVSIMRMEAGLDTGPVIAQAPCSIASTDTSTMLFERLAHLGARVLLQVLADMPSDGIAAPQCEGQVTYAHKICKEEACLDWSQDAWHILRKINAFQPWPVGYTIYQQRRIRIWQAQVIEQSTPPGLLTLSPQGEILVGCGRGSLSVQRLQLSGGKIITQRDFLNSCPSWFKTGIVLGI